MDGLPLKQYYYGWRSPLISVQYLIAQFSYLSNFFKIYDNNFISGMIGGIIVTPSVYF